MQDHQTAVFAQNVFIDSSVHVQRNHDLVRDNAQTVVKAENYSQGLILCCRMMDCTRCQNELHSMLSSTGCLYAQIHNNTHRKITKPTPETYSNSR
jgi:hypothetical protein